MFKLLDKFVKIFFFIFSPLIILFISFFSLFYPIRLGSIPTQRVGHLSAEMSLYLYNKKKNKSFDVFFPQKIISNWTLYSLIKEKLFVLNSSIVFPIYKVLIFCANYFSFFNRYLVRTTLFDYKNIINNKIKFTPGQNFKEQGDTFIKKLGIKKKDKIVLLCTRDSEYLRKKFPKQNFNYHSYRNCNPKNFIPAIKLLIKKGYYIFQMGESSNVKFDINHKQFIQYSRKYRTDFLDIYISYRCQFCISTSLGIDGVSNYIFKKPLLLTNIVPLKDLCQYATNSNIIFMFKEYVDKTTKKKLNFKEMYNKKLFSAYKTKYFKKQNASLIENDAKSIKNAVKEMIEFINLKKKRSANNFFWKNYEELFKIKRENYYLKPNSSPSHSFIRKRSYLFKY